MEKLTAYTYQNPKLSLTGGIVDPEKSSYWDFPEYQAAWHRMKDKFFKTDQVYLVGRRLHPC